MSNRINFHCGIITFGCSSCFFGYIWMFHVIICDYPGIIKTLFPMLFNLGFKILSLFFNKDGIGNFNIRSDLTFGAYTAYHADLAGAKKDQ